MLHLCSPFCDVNYVWPNKDGKPALTLLHIVISKGPSINYAVHGLSVEQALGETINVLIERGAQTAGIKSVGWTPLAAAVSALNYSAVRHLLQIGRED